MSSPIENLRDGLEHLRDANMVPHPATEADVRDVVAGRATYLLEELDKIDRRLRVVELEPALLEDAPMVGHLIARELAEHGRVELWRGSMPPGLVGAVSRTIVLGDDPFPKARALIASPWNKAAELPETIAEAIAELDAAEAS